MKNKILLVSLFIILAGGSLFYWFQIRPAKIKHDCSWVTTHFDKVPAKPAKTEDEVFAASKLSKEDYERSLKLARGEIQPRKDNTGGIDISGLQDRLLMIKGEDMIKQIQGFSEVPARDETRQADTEEYSFCLHNKGL